MSIFSNLRETNPGQSNTARILDNLDRTLITNGNPLEGIKKGAFSMENWDESTRGQVMNQVEGLKNSLREVIESEAAEDSTYDSRQIESAQMAALANSARAEIFRRTDINNQIQLNDREQLVNPGDIDSGEPNVGRLAETASTEAYDNTENRNAMMLSFTYNLKAARQDEFGEAFFPTVICDPDTAAVNITVDLLNVFEDTKRKIDGSLNYQFNRRSLVAAIVYPTILNNDTTRVYPVYRAGDPKVTRNFVDTGDVAPRTIELENGELVTTAPLKVGAEFDLIGLSGTDTLLSQGQLDQTDALDASVRLQCIYVKLKDNQVIAFDGLDLVPEATYTYSVQGNNRLMTVNFDSRFVEVNATTKKVDGTALNNPAVTANQKVKLNVKMFGTVNLETGWTSLSFGGMSVLSVHNAANEKLDLESGAGQTTAQTFEDAKVIGYDLIARRINTNRRERGQLLDLNRERMVYSLPVLAPISVVRPAIENDGSDDVRLDRLVTTTYIRCSNAAVRVLLAAEKHLAGLPVELEPQLLYKSGTLGAARFFLNPYYHHAYLDVNAALNTLKSSDRIVDVQAVLVNKIRDMVYRGFLESNYKAAADVLIGDTTAKPLVIIGTDPYIAAYLQVTGDLRTLGDQFNVKVVSTPNETMRNKIIMAFGKASNGSADTMNPLHFGNMFWRPELASVLNISRNNTISRELTVQPSFLHVVHCPIMMSISVSNLPDAVTQMVPVQIHATP